MEPPGDEILLQQIGAAKYMNPHPVYNKKGKKALRGHQNLFEEFRRVGTKNALSEERTKYILCPAQVLDSSITEISITFLDTPTLTVWRHIWNG